MRWRRWNADSEGFEEPIVNLTPLIDVVFVVLISFMLIAPVLETESVDLATARTEKKKNNPSLETAPLSIVVKGDNTLWMQGQRCSIAELEKILRAQKKLHPGKNPQVIHDKNASFGTYQSVKNALENCGFDQMDIILKPG
ncbi:MAG TPA: biopolymer transporter ExbD [Chlamydiales bacterium]|jgi:biopolymer transport protein ExbD|nr:biopolymer transporter ExbD [Chlamydiales bacterium]